ncbi:MAG: ABC transporter ATP-binding protein [Rectinema sp.]
MKNTPIPKVEMQHVSKSFPGVLANDCVDLKLHKGEVLALLGENGAGKTTLMNILCGLYRPDSGMIFIDGRQVEIQSPRDAQKYGIGMVHQHFKLVDSMSVLENIILGLRNEPFVLDLQRVRNRLVALAAQYHLDVDPDVSVWQLSVGEQQRVEILKLLYRDAEILILDEPTAVLTPQESHELGRVVHVMKQEGKSAIFITHKMEEVMEFSDRVMVLRKGKVVAEVNTAETTPRALAKMMVGRDVLFQIDKKTTSPGNVVLELSRIEALGDRGLPALKDVSFQLRAGEILGVAGVAGNGQTELAEVITGLRRSTKGKLTIAGEDMTNSPPLQIIRRGVAHIPQDRTSVGAVGDLSVASNLAMKQYRSRPLSAGFFLSPNNILDFARTLIEKFHIFTPSPQTQVKFLSGGNIQKTILAREIEAAKTVLVAVYPSRGLDIGATETVHRLLVSQRDAGLGVLFFSEDLDELLHISDRIAVLFEGRIMGIFDANEVTIERLGMLMAGVREEEGA